MLYVFHRSLRIMRYWFHTFVQHCMSAHSNCLRCAHLALRWILCARSVYADSSADKHVANGTTARRVSPFLNTISLTICVYRQKTQTHSLSGGPQ